MANNRGFFGKGLVRGLALVGLGLAFLIAPMTTPAAHADADYGNGCFLYSNNISATVDSLRFRCSPDQQNAIYRDAGAGDVPQGARNGWVVSPRDMQSWAPLFWIGKTFYTSPSGGYLENRITGAGIEGWPAYVYSGPSIVDGGAAWILNYAPSPTPQVYDEIREITPGVWFGYSWEQQGGGYNLQLSFVLA